MFDGMELKESIGTGAFGSVYRAVKDNINYAVKKVSKALLLSEQKKIYFNNEIYLLKQLKHNNIAQYIDKKETFSSYYLILEYCNGGTLLNALDTHMKIHNKPLSEDTVRYLAKQILEGLVYLRKLDIIHRDIKAENILLSFNNESDKDKMDISKATVKIIDFGFARYLSKDELASSVIGTPLCMDPCILSALNNDKVVYNEKCDIWSLGILVYQLLMGTPPFEGNSTNELYDNVTKFRCSIPSSKKDIKLTNECVSFINKMLSIDECKRPSAEELLKEPFIIGKSKYCKLLSLKSNNEIKGKCCFTDYWEDADDYIRSAMTTREKSPVNKYCKDSEANEVDYVLNLNNKTPMVYKEKEKEIGRITIRRVVKNGNGNCNGNNNKDSEVNKAKAFVKVKKHCRRSSTPSQLDEYRNTNAANSFLLAKSFLKPLIKC